MTITEFIEARLTEDEQVAAEAAHMPGRHWDYSGGGQPDRERDGILWDDDHANIVAYYDDHLACAIHSARHDPGRVQREAAAKRAIVTLHKIDTTYTDSRDDNDHPVKVPEVTCYWCGWASDIEGSGCATLRTLATIWRNHPDYDPSWAPNPT